MNQANTGNLTRLLLIIAILCSVQFTGILMAQGSFIGTEAEFVNTHSRQRFDINSSTRAVHEIEDISSEGFGFTTRVQRLRTFEHNQNLISLRQENIGDVVSLNFFDTKQYQAVIQSVHVNDVGRTVITAQIRGRQFAYCHIIVGESTITIRAKLPFDDEFFFASTTHGQTILGQMRLSDLLDDVLPSGAPLIPPVDQGNVGVREIRNNNDPWLPVTIDLLYAYTPAARQWALTEPSVTDIDDVIDITLADANLAATNSDTGITFRIAHRFLFNYVEQNIQGNSAADLAAFTDDALVNQIRNIHSADVMVLLAELHYTGGLAWGLNDPNGFSPFLDRYASNINRVQQVTRTHTVIHEIAHNMGAHHHREQAVEPGPNMALGNHAAGWKGIIAGERRSTLMSYTSGYPSGFEYPNIPYFSSPLVILSGTPIGDAELADNARVLRRTKIATANYRATLNPIQNVTLSLPSAGAMNVSVTPTLSWSQSPGAVPTRYHVQISRSSTFETLVLNEIVAHPSTTFDVPYPTLERGRTYHWRVVAQNANAAATAPIPTRSFTTIMGQYPPINLSADVVGNSVTLNWQAPTERPVTPGWFKHHLWQSGGVMGNRFGLGGEREFTIASRYSPDHLLDKQVAGGSLTHVRFLMNGGGFQQSYTLKIWVTNVGELPGTPMLTQFVTNHSGGTTWTENIALATPISIPTNQELWIGVHIVTQGGHPAVSDISTVVAVPGYSNAIFLYGQWTTWAAVSNPTSNTNWIIEGLAALPTGQRVALGSRGSESTRENSFSAIIYNEITLDMDRFLSANHSLPTITTDHIRTPTGYRVHRGNTLLTPTPITTLSFTDTNVPRGLHTYHVRAVYPTGDSAPASIEAHVESALTFNPPRDLQASPRYAAVNLTWRAPIAGSSGTLLGYRVSRGTTLLTPNPITELTFADTDVPLGQHTYRVVAVYSGGGESAPATISTRVTNPTFTITPTSHEFGANVLNRASVLQTFTIKNTGGAGLVIQTISTTGVDSGQFILTNTNTLPFTLNADQSITFNVTFRPRTTGDKAANIAIRDNINTNVHLVSISGTGFALTPPFDLESTVTNNDVDLNWEFVGGMSLFKGFNVYRDDVKLTDEPITIQSFTDPNVPNGTYNYHVTVYYNEIGESARISRQVTVDSTSEHDLIANITRTELLGNFPNPFNPETVLKFALVNDDFVTLEIFNIRGQKIKTLVNGHLNRGIHHIAWNGTDDQGQSVGSGMYLYRLQAGDFHDMQRMILLK